VPEFDAAFLGLVRRGVGALLVSNEVLFTSHRDQVVALAARHAHAGHVLPIRSSLQPAGLMSYDRAATDGYRSAASTSARILKGERPRDMPVRQPTKFELVVNLKAAKGDQLTIQPSLLRCRRGDRMTWREFHHVSRKCKEDTMNIARQN